jgi:hypothetical protein
MPFYGRLGFVCVGAPFIEAGIPTGAWNEFSFPAGHDGEPQAKLMMFTLSH